MVNRDIIKTGIPLPVVGTVSVAALGIIAILFFMSRRKKKVTLAL